jgi:glycerol-3-phosphate dehydrogenase
VAERAVDLVARRLGRELRPCRTAVTPLEDARLAEPPLEDAARRAVRDEMAVTLADAVLRRLDVGTAGPPPPGELDTVARVMAAELGWDDLRGRRERADLARFYTAPAR